MKLEDGTEVEVFSKDELEIQKVEASQKAIDDYKVANPDKSTELTELQEKLDAKEKELEESLNSDGGLNFKHLRELNKKIEAERDALKKDIDEKISKAKQEVLGSAVQGIYSEELEKLSFGDVELKKKIEFHYKRLSDPASSKDEVMKKLNDAATLANPRRAVGVLNAKVISSAGANRPQYSIETMSPELKGVANRLGITDEDIKKHATKK